MRLPYFSGSREAPANAKHLAVKNVSIESIDDCCSWMKMAFKAERREPSGEPSFTGGLALNRFLKHFGMRRKPLKSNLS
jgi:hypothetical protein